MKVKVVWICVLVSCVFQLRAQRYYGGNGTGYKSVTIESFAAGGNPNAKYFGASGGGSGCSAAETFMAGGNPNAKFFGGTGNGFGSQTVNSYFLNGANANARYVGGAGTGYHYGSTETFVSGGNPNARFFGGSGSGYHTQQGQSSQMLPVVLTAFDAVRIHHKVELTWATVQELDNRKFEVQRSTDMQEISTLMEIAGSGTSSTIKRYRVFDEHPLSGVSYYRLKQTDHNGSVHYSKWIAVKDEESNQKGFVIAPNPNTGNFKVEVQFAFTEVLLFDLNGQMLQQRSAGDGNQLGFDHIAPGLYIVLLKSTDGRVKTAKVYVY